MDLEEYYKDLMLSENEMTNNNLSERDYSIISQSKKSLASEYSKSEG